MHGSSVNGVDMNDCLKSITAQEKLISVSILIGTESLKLILNYFEILGVQFGLMTSNTTSSVRIDVTVTLEVLHDIPVQ